ncbi:unnamed protein product, partial [Cuscuta europaea]
MENFKVYAFGVVFSLFLYFQFPNHFGNGVGAENVGASLNGSKPWGFVDVRPGAHMFWWLQKSPYRVNDPNKPWPIILWLHSGPGASGTGFGNFLEIGPFDANLKPRISTWLKKADLLFVDSPVGVGYSYVDDIGLLTKTDSQAVSDLTTLLIEVFMRNLTLANSTLYIIGESYGAKLAVSLGLSVLNATQAKRLSVNLGGVTLGSSWISPEDYVVSWGPLLQTFSRIDDIDLEKVNSLANQIKQKIGEGNFVGAAELYLPIRGVIGNYSNEVDLYNLLEDSMDSTVSSTTASTTLNNVMNGVIKKILRLPENISWVGVSLPVFSNMSTDFMKPRIDEVDQLLDKEVDVTIYNGQVDLICGPTATKAWIQKLKWPGLKAYLNTSRTPLYCCGSNKTRGFLKSYMNFHFYTILGAGHFVPADQPDITLQM